MSDVPYASQFTRDGNYVDLATQQPDPVQASRAGALLPWQQAEVAARRLAQARSILDRLDRAVTLDERIRAERILAEAEGDD